MDYGVYNTLGYGFLFLLNFGAKPQFKRKLFYNETKKYQF
jgi:hypothetical protein